MKETISFLNKLLKEEDVIIAACSGGPDSMCLLNVLNSLKKDLNLKIICAHVNHGLREESKKEAEFVKEYCYKNNLTFEYFVIDGYKNNKFSEQEGRNKRYEFFEKLVFKHKAKFLMTAHHGDDLTETILMRIVRGSNLKGYAGISKILENPNYKIVRPLLTISKDMILNYLDENDIPYVVDNSNEDEKYTRNRFRKHMLPELKKEDNLVHLKFLKYSEELELAQKYINRQIKLVINDIYVENYIVINKLLEQDEYLQEKILEYIIEDIQKKYIFNINDNQFHNIIDLIKGSNNKEINLADGFVARKSYNKLYLLKTNNEDIRKEYKYILDNEINILNRYKFMKLDNTKEKSNYVIRLNSSEINLPLIIRTKLNGDKIKVKNLSGTKKIKDLFIDCKMELTKRSEYPIVTDSKNTIIWVPGIKKSIFDKEINEKYDIIIKYMEEENE